MKNWTVAREMPKLLNKLGMIDKEQMGTYYCCHDMGDKGYRRLDWAIRVFIFISTSFYIWATAALFYCVRITKKAD